MIDVIVFCPDTTKLVAAVKKTWPERLDETDPDNPRFLLGKTPTRRNGAETLAVARCRDGEPGEPLILAGLQQLEAAGVIKILGTLDEVLGPEDPEIGERDLSQGDPEAQEIYFRVWPRTPVTFKDEDGVEHTFVPPLEIGRFA